MKTKKLYLVITPSERFEKDERFIESFTNKKKWMECFYHTCEGFEISLLNLKLVPKIVEHIESGGTYDLKVPYTTNIISLRVIYVP